MDKASAYEAGDCGFESRRRLFFLCSTPHPNLTETPTVLALLLLPPPRHRGLRSVGSIRCGHRELRRIGCRNGPLDYSRSDPRPAAVLVIVLVAVLVLYTATQRSPGERAVMATQTRTWTWTPRTLSLSRPTACKVRQGGGQDHKMTHTLDEPILDVLSTPAHRSCHRHPRVKQPQAQPSLRCPRLVV